MTQGPNMSPLERFRRSANQTSARDARSEGSPAAVHGVEGDRDPAAADGYRDRAARSESALGVLPGTAQVPALAPPAAGDDGSPPRSGNYPRPVIARGDGRAELPPSPTSPASLGITRLSPHAVAVPALASNVRPALVLREREARGLLAEARRHDVGVGGSFSAGPAGIQVWSGPFDGPGGSHGSAVHLGSVDWIYDTPVRYYATIYRAMVTAQGIAVEQNPHTILESVLRLTGLTVEGTRLTMPMPPPRDPFRRRA